MQRTPIVTLKLKILKECKEREFDCGK